MTLHRHTFFEPQSHKACESAGAPAFGKMEEKYSLLFSLLRTTKNLDVVCKTNTRRPRNAESGRQTVEGPWHPRNTVLVSPWGLHFALQIPDLKLKCQ